MVFGELPEWIWLKNAQKVHHGAYSVEVCLWLTYHFYTILIFASHSPCENCILCYQAYTLQIMKKVYVSVIVRSILPRYDDLPDFQM